MASSTADPTILSSKRAVYIGGLADAATPNLLRAAMIPFGNIKSLDIPMDYAKGLHRGFGFVEYEDADDATEAVFNMDGADLMGRTIRVSLAQPNQLNKISSGGGTKSSSQAIWSSDEWFQQHAAGGGGGGPEQDQQNQQQKEDQQVLKD